MRRRGRDRRAEIRSCKACFKTLQRIPAFSSPRPVWALATFTSAEASGKLRFSFPYSSHSSFRKSLDKNTQEVLLEIMILEFLLASWMVSIWSVISFIRAK